MSGNQHLKRGKKVEEYKIEKSVCLEKRFMISFKWVYWVMMQNEFLTVSLVQRFEKPYIEAILLNCLPCLILRRVLLGSNCKMISLGNTLRTQF